MAGCGAFTADASRCASRRLSTPHAGPCAALPPGCRACDADLVRGGGAALRAVSGGAPLLRLRGRFHRGRRARNRPERGAAAAAARRARPAAPRLRLVRQGGLDDDAPQARPRRLPEIAALAQAARRLVRLRSGGAVARRRRPGQARHLRVLWRRVHVLYDPTRAGVAHALGLQLLVLGRRGGLPPAAAQGQPLDALPEHHARGVGAADGQRLRRQPSRRRAFGRPSGRGAARRRAAAPRPRRGGRRRRVGGARGRARQPAAARARRDDRGAADGGVARPRARSDGACSRSHPKLAKFWKGNTNTWGPRHAPSAAERGSPRSSRPTSRCTARAAQRLWQTYKDAFGGGNATEAPSGAPGGTPPAAGRAGRR